jgi:phosphatidylglycerophosphate synthase
MSKATASGALGLAFASALASLCCLPIASGAFAIALAALAGAVTPWWPLLASASLILLAAAVVQTVRGKGGAGVDRCEMEHRHKRQWLFVSIIGFLTLVLLTLPWWSAAVAYHVIQ